jgi:mono/diheme cytochrome c family protein
VGLRRLDILRYRASVVGLAAGLACTVTACGGSSSTPAASSGTSSSSLSTSATTTTSSSTAGSTASESEGHQVFVSAGCGGCHTLAAAHASGTVGPNLDQLKPAYAAVVSQVTHGGGEMPSFSAKLSTAQIQAVAKFVVSATR